MDKSYLLGMISQNNLALKLTRLAENHEYLYYYGFTSNKEQSSIIQSNESLIYAFKTLKTTSNPENSLAEVGRIDLEIFRTRDFPVRFRGNPADAHEKDLVPPGGFANIPGISSSTHKGRGNSSYSSSKENFEDVPDSVFMDIDLERKFIIGYIVLGC
jgi:hypothetical protein